MGEVIEAEMYECEWCGHVVVSVTCEPRQCHACGRVNGGGRMIWANDPNDLGHP